MFSRNLIRFYLLVLVLLGSFSFVFAQEEFEVKWKDGKKYMVHHIKSGDTWSGISRKYKMAVKSLQQINPKAIDLKYGFTILIPYDNYLNAKNGVSQVNLSKENSEISNHKANSKGLRLDDDIKTIEAIDTAKSINKSSVHSKTSTGNSISQSVSVDEVITHKVQSGETLFGIAKKYNLNYNELAKFNLLKSNSIKAGQVIKIPVNNKNSVDFNNINISENNPSKVDDVHSDSSSTITSAYKEINGTIIEQGVATWLMDLGSSKNEKFYALHRSAPIGTIVKVKNPMTSRSVFVKVVGVLPDTGDNHDVLIKITQSAARRLGIIDSRFRVEISYKSKPGSSK